ncbi:BQ5605_C001g00781 [Microbotryum silenes-dioicae]|uniref:BQ5605_C001g00781 protein n=1 Tax=Microbotryum silenes-dioicae TaxID=796604 RepID=A0A2X0P0S7_9BASI|nr:BQ5605_C001g00781 [Microbotryum silenes-dioicae]
MEHSMNRTVGPSATDVPRYVAEQFIATGIWGPFALGMLLDIYLGGFAMSLFLRYVQSAAWKADGWRLQLLLVASVVLSTVDIGFSFWSTWFYTIRQSRTTADVEGQTVVDALSLVPVGLLMGPMIQVYLARRASSLFTNRFNKMAYFVFLGLSIGFSMAAGVLYTVLSFHCRATGRDAIGTFDFNKSLGAYCGATCVTDMTITIALVVQYRARMVGDPRSRTDSAMRSLIKLAIHSAMYTSTFALLGAVFEFSFSVSDVRKSILYAFQCALGSMYLISLLVNLDSRSHLRELFTSTPILPDDAVNGLSGGGTTEVGLPSFISARSSPLPGTKQAYGSEERGKIGSGSSWGRFRSSASHFT